MDLTLNTNPQNTFDYMDSTASANKKFACTLHLKPYIHVSWYQSSNALSQIQKRGFHPSVAAHRDGQIYTEPEMVSLLKSRGRVYP